MDIPARDDESTHLKSQRNARLPVFRLSADALLAIFFLLRNTEQIPGEAKWDWEAIAKICKHWRDLAIGCSGLWTYITTSSRLNRIRAFLERSRRAELFVYMNGIDTDGDEDALTALLMDHMWRVRSLAGRASDLGQTNVETLLRGMTERFKVLTLRSNRERNTGPALLLDVHDICPIIQLDVLILNAVSLPWSSSIYRGLTVLELTDESQSISKPSVNELRDILEHCPNLRRLKLDGIWPLNTDNAEAKKNIPRLPNLESVELDHILFSASALFFMAFAVEDDVELDAAFDAYEVRDSQPLPITVLQKRKCCKKICLDISDRRITLESLPHKNGAITSSRTTITIFTCFSFHSVYVTRSIGALLRDTFWKAADEVILSFDDFNPHSKMACMNSFSWGILLDSLPANTRSLQIEILFKEYSERSALYRANPSLDLNLVEEYTIFAGLPEALSEIKDDSGAVVGIRLPELEKLTIIYEDLTKKQAKRCHEYLLTLLEERIKHTSHTCTVRFKGIVDFEGKIGRGLRPTEPSSYRLPVRSRSL